MAYYRCSSCGQIFEVADDRTNTYCPHCGKHQLLPGANGKEPEQPVQQAPVPKQPVPKQQPYQPRGSVFQQNNFNTGQQNSVPMPIGQGAVPYPEMPSLSIQAKKGMNKGLLFGLICGGAALMIAAVVILAVVFGSR